MPAPTSGVGGDNTTRLAAAEQLRKLGAEQGASSDSVVASTLEALTRGLLPDQVYPAGDGSTGIMPAFVFAEVFSLGVAIITHKSVSQSKANHRPRAGAKSASHRQFWPCRRSRRQCGNRPHESAIRYRRL